MKALVCAVLLACVLIIVIAPQVDLPPTALRAAQRLVVPLQIQLATLVLAFTLPIHISHSTLGFAAFRETPSPPVLSLLSTICVLLC